LEFYLKRYSQSKFSQYSVFKIKQKKKKNISKLTTSKAYSGVYAFNYPAWTARGSLTVGPGGPLVRFDQSPFPLLPLPERGRDSGDRRWRLASPRGAPRAGWIRHSRAVLRWSPGRRGRRELPTASSSVEVASGAFGGRGYGGSRAGLRCWAAPRDHGDSNGGTSLTGGARVVTEWTGGRRRLILPELGKMTSSLRLLATGELGEWTEIAWVLR